MSEGRLRTALLTLAGVLVAAGTMLQTFDGPFRRSWLGHNGARYAQMARNYDRLGFAALRGAPTIAPAGRFDRSAPEIYAHHPPGMPLAVAVAFRALGESEAVARLVPAVATVLALLVLGRLVGTVGGAAAGGLAVLAAGSMPMVSVYGAHVDPQGPPVVLFGLLVVLAYRRWLDGRGGPAPVLVAAAVASAFDWYGLYAPMACAVHLAATRPGARRAAAGLAAATLLLFAAWLAWLATLPGQSLGVLGKAAGVRLAGALSADPEATARHLSAWWRDTLALMPGWPVLLALAAAIVFRWLRPGGTARDRGLGARGLVAMLAAPPLVHGALFPAGLVVHDYWLFALPYGLAAAFALGAARLAPVPRTAATVLLVAAGVLSARGVLADEDPLPALLGAALARETAPGEVVLTDYPVNPLIPGASDDAYLLTRPEVTYYADRAVRGAVGAPGGPGLAEALARVPDARWFLSFGGDWASAQGLREALAARGAGEPRPLPEDPRVLLFPLSP